MKRRGRVNKTPSTNLKLSYWAGRLGYATAATEPMTFQATGEGNVDVAAAVALLSQLMYVTNIGNMHGYSR